VNTPREYLAKIGRKGGLKRRLTAEQARNMVRIRELRKLNRKRK